MTKFGLQKKCFFSSSYPFVEVSSRAWILVICCIAAINLMVMIERNMTLYPSPCPVFLNLKGYVKHKQNLDAYVRPLWSTLLFRINIRNSVVVLDADIAALIFIFILAILILKTQLYL